MKSSIMITGAGGFTGQHACRHFLNMGMNVTAVVLRKESQETLSELFPDCKVIRCDLTKREQVNELVQEALPNYILHLAGRNEVRQSWKEPTSYIETNMMSTLYLLDALRNNGLASCHVLIAGSMLSFSLSGSPQPPHPYSFSKTFQVLTARCWGHMFNQSILIAEPSNLIGPGYSNGICGLIAKKIVEVESEVDSAPFHLSSLTEERDYVDVRDAVIAYGKILYHGKPGGVYPIGSGRNHSLGELVNIFRSLSQKQLPLEVGRTTNPSQLKDLDMSPMKALGWQPVIPFEQSIKDILEFFRTEGRLGRRK